MTYCHGNSILSNILWQFLKSIPVIFGEGVLFLSAGGAGCDNMWHCWYYIIIKLLLLYYYYPLPCHLLSQAVTYSAISCWCDKRLSQPSQTKRRVTVWVAEKVEVGRAGGRQDPDWSVSSCSPSDCSDGSDGAPVNQRPPVRRVLRPAGNTGCTLQGSEPWRDDSLYFSFEKLWIEDIFNEYFKINFIVNYVTDQ